MSEQRRFLGRSISDFTRTTADDLRAPTVVVEHMAVTEEHRASCQVICIASGKGGTGKTVMATNLAVQLARDGLNVVLFDADLGLANAHLLLGVYPMHDMMSVISGELHISDIMVEGPFGVRLIAGGSGSSDLAELKDWQLRYLADELRQCEDSADVILVDMSAGISPQVMRFLEASHDVIIVTTPDATALLDAYATIKLIAQGGMHRRVQLVVNRARDREDAIEALKKILAVADRYRIGIEISFLGWVPSHWCIQDSISRRQPVVLCHPRSLATRHFEEIASGVRATHDGWMHERMQEIASIPLDAVDYSQEVSFSARLGKMTYS